MTSQTTIKFISIPESVLSRKDLSATDKLLYGVLRFHQYGSAECRPDQEQLAAAIGCSVRAVGKSVQRLQDAGLLSIQRRFKRSNVYRVDLCKDPVYLRVPESVLMADMPATHKIIVASLDFKASNQDRQAWPFQARLAAELGCSRSSVVRALNELETAGKIQVTHRGGGRSRGNIYRPTDAFYSVLLTHGQTETVSKVPNRKTNNSEELKRTPPQVAPSARLSGYRLTGSTTRTQPASTPQEQAEERLRRVGVHPAVAASLVWDQHHPPASIEQAVNNALLRQASHRQAGLDRLKPFSAAAYVVGSLNQARKEAHLVKPSRIFVAAKVKTEAKRTPWTPPSEKDFEAMRRKALAGLVARKVAS